jgi:uncharacterized sporulation protein YeaH/YhbH (DUF444 family)
MHTISSSEAEGVFNEFIDDRLSDLVTDIVNEGDISAHGGRNSDIVLEIDDIAPPRFTYGREGGAGSGAGSGGPGDGAGKLRFRLPLKRFMELVGRKLALPDLTKDGEGRIKEVTYSFKTVGTCGVILDKKRTFKRALKTSVACGRYRPEAGVRDVLVRRRDRRFKLPERVERPRHRAVVLYIGDISYSTYGERLELTKRIVNFTHHWIDYNYGAGNVDHRFFVHDVVAHEVLAEQFYEVSNAGGTRAAGAFELASQIAGNEYAPGATNLYAFYFGDGELLPDDAEAITDIIGTDMVGVFNRVGLVEVKPSRMSRLHKAVSSRFEGRRDVRTAVLDDAQGISPTIQVLFGNRTCVSAGAEAED